jgi:hypothetical protein
MPGPGEEETVTRKNKHFHKTLESQGRILPYIFTATRNLRETLSALLEHVHR